MMMRASCPSTAISPVTGPLAGALARERQGPHSLADESTRGARVRRRGQVSKVQGREASPSGEGHARGRVRPVATTPWTEPGSRARPRPLRAASSSRRCSRAWRKATAVPYLMDGTPPEAGSRPASPSSFAPPQRGAAARSRGRGSGPARSPWPPAPVGCGQRRRRVSAPVP